MASFQPFHIKVGRIFQIKVDLIFVLMLAAAICP